MFTYAFARHIMELRKRETLVISNFKRSRTGSEAEGFTDTLKHFNVVSYCQESADMTLKYGSLSQKVIYLAYMLLSKTPWLGRSDRFMDSVTKEMEHFGFFFTGPADKARPLTSLPEKDNIFIRGYFQDKGNFDVIRQILLQEFTPVLPPLEANRQLYDAIARPNSVCVSVRRGDYLSPQYKDDFYVCTPQYFRKAMRLIREKTANPTFIFFSNDIEWVRDNIKTDGPCYYESGNDPAWETLRLMYSCHHFIISNSTFAWWAHYLGRREGKIVVSPSRWYANSNWSSNLIDESFLKVDI